MADEHKLRVLLYSIFWGKWSSEVVWDMCLWHREVLLGEGTVGECHGAVQSSCIHYRMALHKSRHTCSPHLSCKVDTITHGVCPRCGAWLDDASHISWSSSKYKLLVYPKTAGERIPKIIPDNLLARCKAILADYERSLVLMKVNRVAMPVLHQPDTSHSLSLYCGYLMNLPNWRLWICLVPLAISDVS